jgi:hypothetical protein
MARISVTLVLAAALALAVAGPAQAAAPRLIMISGEPLAEPILLDDAEEVFALYQAFFFEGDPVARIALQGRPSLRLALFWDNALWEPYVRDGRLAELRPTDANQFGRFYPAVGGEPALVDLRAHGRWPKIVGEAGRHILEARGIPVGVGEDDSDELPLIAAGAVAAGLLALGLVLVTRRASRTNA